MNYIKECHFAIAVCVCAVNSGAVKDCFNRNHNILDGYLTVAVNVACRSGEGDFSKLYALANLADVHSFSGSIGRGLGEYGFFIIVTESRDFIICGVVATRAGLISVPTVFFTSGGFSFVVDVVVSESCEFFICCIVTTGACLVRIPPNFGASLRLCFVVDIIVTESCYLRIS